MTLISVASFLLGLVTLLLVVVGAAAYMMRREKKRETPPAAASATSLAPKPKEGNRWRKFARFVMGWGVIIVLVLLISRAVMKISESASEEWQTFALKKGERVATIYFSGAKGIEHLVNATVRYRAYSRQPDGSVKTYVFPAGQSRWKSNGAIGHLEVEGLEEGGLIEFKRIHF